MKRKSFLLPFLFTLSSLASCNLSSFFNLDEEKTLETTKKGTTEEDMKAVVPLERIDADKTYSSSTKVIDQGDTTTIKELLAKDYFVSTDLNHYGNKVTYNKKIEIPTHIVSNVNELADVLDYHAFYADGNSFGVTLTDDYSGANKNAIVSAFFKSKLCPSTVGLNYAYKDKKFSIQMVFNKEANKYKSKTEYLDDKSSIPYSFPTTKGNRANNFSDFKYLTTNTRGEVDVYNSEQVLYALENGYKPLPIANSPAEAIMNKAKELLIKIIKEDMEEIDKITAIYSYIQANCTYDDQGEHTSTYRVSKDKIFPDFTASHFRSFYAEGCLFDGANTCHGYAKGFNILATLEGIVTTKVTSRFKDFEEDTISSIMGDEDKMGMYYNHGYSYVLNPKDKKYYIVDPTYAYSGVVNSLGVTSFRRGAIMKSYEDWLKVYSPVDDKHHLDFDLGKTSLDNSKCRKIGSDLTFSVDKISDVSQYINKLTTFMSSFKDTSYKTNSEYYTVNLTIKEIENAGSDNFDNYTSQLNNISHNKLKYKSFPHYFGSDQGVQMVFSF